MTHHVLTLNNYLLKPFESLLDAFRSFLKMREENVKIKETIKELRKLSDKELNDIGIARGDIISVARGDETLKRAW